MSAKLFNDAAKIVSINEVRQAFKERKKSEFSLSEKFLYATILVPTSQLASVGILLNKAKNPDQFHGLYRDPATKETYVSGEFIQAVLDYSNSWPDVMPGLAKKSTELFISVFDEAKDHKNRIAVLEPM